MAAPLADGGLGVPRLAVLVLRGLSRLLGLLVGGGEELLAALVDGLLEGGGHHLDGALPALILYGVSVLVELSVG